MLNEFCSARFEKCGLNSSSSEYGPLVADYFDHVNEILGSKKGENLLSS
jgi:hypothetical protein